MMLPCSRLLLTALLLLGITSWAPAQPNWSSPGPALTEDRALTAGGPVGARTENITGLGGTGAPIQPEPGGTGTNNPSQSGATWTNAPSQPEDTGTNALSEPEGNGTNTPSPLGETGSDGALAPEGNGTNTPSPLGETGANAPSEPEGNGTNTPLGLASSRTESRLVGTGTTLPSEMGGTESKTSLAQERTGTSIRGEPVTTEIHNQSDSGGSGTHNPHKIGAVKTHISSDPEEAGISISPEPETLGTYFATEPRRTWTPNKTTQDRNVSDPPWMDPHTPSELTGTMNWTKVGQSQLGSRTELYMTTGSDMDIIQKDGQTSSATEPIQKSATKRHANEGTSDTMYFSTTFHRGSDRTLLSVTNSSVTSDITDLLTAYNTAVDSSSAKTSLARGREITKNSGITAQDFNVTTRDSDVTTRDSGITVRGLGFSTQYSGITTQDSTVPTQESGTTQQNTNTTSYSSVSVPGSDPLMTPYRIPTASSPSVHHYSDSTVPVTTVPVTTANTTDLFTGQEVPTNNSFLDPSLSSSSSSPTNSSFSFNSSLFITDSSSSTVSFTSSQFTRETVSSSTYKETTMSSLPITESSSSGAFSSSPIPSTLVLSTQSSASPTPHSEIPPQSSSTSSYFSLSPTSRLPLVPSVSPSTSQLPKTYTTSPTAGSTETNVILTTPESLNQTVQSSTAPITSYHTGITQTTQRNGHSTITEATRTDGTGSSGAMNNTSFPMTGDLSVYTRKPIEGTALATTSSAERSTLSRVDGPVQPAVSEPPATSKGVFIKPQDSSQPPLIGSSESSLTTNVPKKLLPKETTTKLDQSTSSSLLDLRTSTAAHTKSRKEAQTTISVRTGVYPTTFATTPSTIVASTIVTNTASSAFSLCLLNPCQNGGLCVIDIINKSYRCVCPPAWQGQHCGNDVDECLSNPCPAQASCSNTKGSFSCRCPLGYILEKGTGCVLARTFLGHIKVPRSFLNSSKYTDLHQIEEEIVRIMNMSFSSISGYYQSTVTDTRDTNHIIVSVQNVFSLASNVTTFDIISNLQNYMRLCESFPEISSGCQLILHPQLYYMAVSLCNLKNPGCDKDTADCTDLTGIAMCQCKPGYFKFSKTDQSCRACEDGFKRENGTCVRCPFGLGGFNCSNPYQLITVIIAAAGGGLLLVLGIALTITCCRKNKNDISKLIYKSGDFQMSPYAEYPKTQRSSEWGRETIEMQENGSTKNLLQMTDVYYSPGLRNSELERNGLYPYTGLPGSRHSCIYPGQYNPSFIGEENRRRDYF